MSYEEPKMKSLLSLGIVSLSLGMSAATLSGSQDRAGNEDVRDRIVGAWRQIRVREPQGATCNSPDLRRCHEL
jgi:hypothetical protein